VSKVRKLSATGAAVAGLAMIVAGCGSSSSGGSGGGTTTLAPAKSVAASTLKTHSTSVGNVLVDAKGRTIYELVGDTATNQTCDKSCQAFWPPVTSGGSQIVVNGHPAFTFVMDTKSGQILGQGSKDTWGTWWVLDSSGNPITGAGVTTPQSPSTATSSSTGSGSGYGY
jgi:predicted lipoprotein with Yx(FWY)xxD motif